MAGKQGKSAVLSGDRGDARHRETDRGRAGRLARHGGGFISALCRYDDEPVELEPYQLAFLANRSRFRWITKSRQVGYSFVAALEALARCHLRDGFTAVFVSFNQDDAKEKVLVARQVFEEMPAAYQKRLVVDSKTELVFESNAAGRRISRIISVPSKPPRGKKGDVCSTSSPTTQRPRGLLGLDGAHPPLPRPAHGLLHAARPARHLLGDRHRGAAQVPAPHPAEVPWWLCRFFCRDVKRAADEAPHLPTEERVAAFGRQLIVEQLDSLPLEDFQQEFENRFVDESYSFYPYDLILPCTSEDLVLCDDFTDVPDSRGSHRGRVRRGPHPRPLGAGGLRGPRREPPAGCSGPTTRCRSPSRRPTCAGCWRRCRSPGCPSTRAASA